MKAVARKAARQRRDSTASPERSADACRHLSDVLSAHPRATLAGYLPIRSEADPRPAMAAHTGLVSVPVVTGKARPLEFHIWTPDADLVEGDFGVMVPKSAQTVNPTLLIVPMLAFTLSGYRLGYGGGFYDRTLEDLRAKGEVRAIGFAFAAQEDPNLPVEATDQPLDMIVTENGVLATTGQRA